MNFVLFLFKIRAFLYSNSKIISLRKNRKIISLLLIIIYIFFFASANLQQHVHIVNGITISHSHFSKDIFPFSSNTPTHSHNSIEINLIHDLNIALFFILFISIIIGIVSQKPIKILPQREILIPLKTCLYNPSLRAPPFC